MNEIQIIQGTRNGKHSTLRRLYKYYPVVRKWLVKRGCNKDQTEDIYQEALLVFCEKCQSPDFQLHCALGTYLLSISKYIFFNKVRKANNVILDDLNEYDIHASEDYDEWKAQEQQLNYAKQALMLIGDRCKSLLAMFYLGQKNMKQIASELGLRNEHVAKSQKYKCLQKAKEAAYNLIKAE